MANKREIPMEKDTSNRSDGAWYLFIPGIGYPRHWQGEPLPAPPVEDSGKAKLSEFLEGFAGAFLDDIKRAGALPFRSLWCGGSCERVFLAPKTQTWLEMIIEKKTQFENLEQTAHEWAPERYAEVALEWERFHPAGHMLVMEAIPVYLPGENAEMQAEAGEMFRCAYGDPGVQLQLTEITEPSADDPDRWYVIIGSLKLAGLDGFQCAEHDCLNSYEEEISLTKAAKAGSPGRQRAQVLVSIHKSLAPELSTGAWFDLEGVRQAWARGEKERERFTDVARLGSHLNLLWCSWTKGIKGPYFLPRAKGIVIRLSEGRRTYRQAIAEKAKELDAEVRSLMLIFEIRSPYLGEQGSDNSERLRGWMEKVKHGISPLCEFYWEGIQLPAYKA